MTPRTVWLPCWALIALLPACVISDFNPSGRPCPCPAGWRCSDPDSPAGMCVVAAFQGDGGTFPDGARDSSFDGAAELDDGSLPEGGPGVINDTAALLAALTAAREMPGPSTIQLGAGPFVLDGELLIDHPVTLIGPSRCGAVIDAAGQGRAIHAVGAQVSLRNLTIQGGSVVGPASGGGVLAEMSAQLEVRDSCVMMNSATGATLGGGGIAVLSGSELIMSFSRVLMNRADLRGGGMVLEGATSASLSDVEISGNRLRATAPQSSYGMGMYVNGATRVSIERALFAENEALEGSTGSVIGALAANGDVILTMQNSTISSNEGTAAGLYVWSNRPESEVPPTMSGAGVSTLKYVTIANNRSGPTDYAIFAPNSRLFLEGVVMSNNTRDGQLGIFNCLGVDSIVSLGNNVGQDINDPFRCGFAAPDDLIMELPLEPLTMDGAGFTRVHPIPAGSPMLGRGTCSTLTDQRSLPRVAPCDPGAYEL